MGVVIFQRPVTVIPVLWGYIAGEEPSGLVTIDNVPRRAIIDLFVRSTNLWIRREWSKDDGTYRFSGLELGVKYDLVGRDETDTWADVIVSRVEAYAPPKITTASLAFSVGMPASTVMESQYGTGPMAWSIDSAPPGLALNGDGAWTGSATIAGSYPVEITVTDIYGELNTKAFTIVVT